MAGNSTSGSSKTGQVKGKTRGLARHRSDPPKHVPADFAADKTSLYWSDAERKQGIRQCLEIIQEIDRCSRAEAIQKIADRFVRTAHTVTKWAGNHRDYQPPPVEAVDVLRFELGLATPQRRRVKPDIIKAALSNMDYALPWPPKE